MSTRVRVVRLVSTTDEVEQARVPPVQEAELVVVEVAATGSGRQVPGTRLEWKLQLDGLLEVRVGPALTEEEEAKRAKAAKQASTSGQKASSGQQDASKKADVAEAKASSGQEDATKKADFEEKKDGTPAPATPEAGASTSAKPSGGC